MRNAEQFSLLLRDIYDAALYPARWADIVTASQDYIGAFAASIVVNDDARYHSGGGGDYGALEQAYRKVVPLPSMLRISRRIVREAEAISIVDALSRAELDETPLFTDWCQPQGVQDVLTYGFIKAPSGSVFLRIGGGAGFAIHRDQGPSSDAAMQRMRLLMPHMRRAILIGNAINLRDAEAATFIHLLDGLRAGIFLIDAEQRMVHANASGRELLSEGETIRIADGKLVANERNGGKTLEIGVARAAKGGPASIGGPVAMSLKATGRTGHVAYLLPLTAGARQSSAERYEAVAVLIVHRTELELPPPYQSFVQRYKLTPAEARVSLAITQIGGIPDVAKALGIGPNTVRTHLQRVFSKTDIRRQADLVRLVAGLASPLLR
jgi:DNA-binding CsgD family transcriptional regulator/PAS domain-containing protein